MARPKALRLPRPPAFMKGPVASFVARTATAIETHARQQDITLSARDRFTPSRDTSPRAALRIAREACVPPRPILLRFAEIGVAILHARYFSRDVPAMSFQLMLPIILAFLSQQFRGGTIRWPFQDMNAAPSRDEVSMPTRASDFRFYAHGRRRLFMC